MGRAYPQEGIVEGFPTERAKVGVSLQSSPPPTLSSIAVQPQAPSAPITNPSRAHFIRQLEEWIDGNQVCSAAHTRDDVGFVEMFYEACLNVFQQLWEHIIGSETPFNSKQKTILRESLGRMVLWSDSLGYGQLDRILGRSDILKGSVLECLLGIAEILVKEFTTLISIGTGNPRLLEEIGELILMNEKARLMNSEDYDSDLESTGSDEEVTGGQSPKFPFLQDIASFSECLMDLLPGLERSSRVHQHTPMDYIDPSPVFQVSEPASPFVSLVLDRFRKASPRLAQRLGEANWQRYVRIRARMGANDGDLLAHTEPVIPCSVFNPVSLFRDSGLGTTVVASSKYAMSTASHTSFVSSLADVNKGSLRVPDEPAEVALGKPFTCAICGHKLYNIKTRIDWKVHVYADLQPYICTWIDCKAELMTFATRKQWAKHEFEQHRVERFWRCQECSAELPSLEDWHNHISKDHPNAVPSRSRLDVSAQLAENSRPMDVVDMNCPLCLKKLGPSRRAFATHVGKHMEQLALAALPKGVSDETESDNISIRAESSESTGRQMGNELSSKSQGKSEFILSSVPDYQSPYDLKSLYNEYSSVGGLCSQQVFHTKLTLLEQQNHIRQPVIIGTTHGEIPGRFAAPFALGEIKSEKFGCSFCGAQPQGKHELRRHLANKHISEFPLREGMQHITFEGSFSPYNFSSDGDQGEHLSDQNSPWAPITDGGTLIRSNTDACIGAQDEHGSSLKEGPPQTERRPGGPDYLEYLKRFHVALQEPLQIAGTDSIKAPATYGASRLPQPMHTVFNQALPLDDDQIEQMSLERSFVGPLKEFNHKFDSSATRTEQQNQNTGQPFLTQEQAPLMANPSHSPPKFPTQLTSTSTMVPSYETNSFLDGGPPEEDKRRPLFPTQLTSTSTIVPPFDEDTIDFSFDVPLPESLGDFQVFSDQHLYSLPPPPSSPPLQSTPSSYNPQPALTPRTQSDLEINKLGSLEELGGIQSPP